MTDELDVKYWLEPATTIPPRWVKEMGMGEHIYQVTYTLFDKATIEACNRVSPGWWLGSKKKCMGGWLDKEKGLYAHRGRSNLLLARNYNDALILEAYPSLIASLGIMFAKILVIDTSERGTPPGFHIATHEDMKKGKYVSLKIRKVWAVPSTYEPYEDSRQASHPMSTL